MKERMHEEMTSEMRQGTRTDTIVVITAIVLNLILLSINCPLAIGAAKAMGLTLKLIFFVLLALVVVLNVVSVYALSKGKERRAKLTEGLLKMYQEEGMEKYYDPSVIKGYSARYTVFTIAVLAFGAIGLLIPLIIFSTL